MPLVGDHQAEDQQLIADMVIAKMNHVMAQNPKRPTAIQPKQVHDVTTHCTENKLSYKKKATKINYLSVMWPAL